MHIVKQHISSSRRKIHKSHGSLNQHTHNRDRDAQVLRLLRQDREAGFEMLFKLYYTEVCHHIYRILPQKEAVEDIAQDLFMEVWNKQDTLTIETSPGAYLYKMARSRALNYIRDNRKHSYQDEAELRHHVSELATPTQKIQADQLSSVVTHAVNALPERCRQVFMLSRFEDMTYKEIADTMDISVKTVENQIIKALKHLRAAIAEFRADE